MENKSLGWHSSLEDERIAKSGSQMSPALGLYPILTSVNHKT
jgi:hypothetical protein